jgi:CRP-like cAMP-binding protein
VFREGDVGDAWYVVFEGRAEVVKGAPSGSARQIARMEPGTCFGEIAILDGGTRSATVKAVEPLTLFRFRRPPFEQLLEQGSLAAYKLVAAMGRVLSQRHRRLTQQIAELADQEKSTGRSVGAQIGGLVDRQTLSD